MNVDLAELVLALGFSRLDYTNGDLAQADKDYLKFEKQLGKMAREYC